ncbi:MAG: alpha/beta hydrolase [Solirubrobacteraceae bacterium]
MLLLHGFTDTWRTWSSVIPALEASHDVLAPTLPGHHGGEPFAPGLGMSIATTTDAVERLMDEAGFEQAHLVGNSLGGWLALQLAVRGRARSVLALCPAGGWEHASRESRTVNAYFRRTHAALRYITPALTRQIAARPRLRALAFRELVARPAAIPPRAAAEMIEGAAKCAIVLEALALADDPRGFDDLGPIDCPVTIAYATRDHIIRWPSHYGRLRGGLLPPQTKWEELTGVGHLPQWDDPQRVAELALATAGDAERQLAARQPAPPSSKMQPE